MAALIPQTSYDPWCDPPSKWDPTRFNKMYPNVAQSVNRSLVLGENINVWWWSNGESHKSAPGWLAILVFKYGIGCPNIIYYFNNQSQYGFKKFVIRVLRVHGVISGSSTWRICHIWPYMIRGYEGIIVTMPELVEGVCFSRNIYICLVKTHVLLQMFP